MKNNARTRKAIAKFVEEYLTIEKGEDKNKVAERSYSQTFWTSFVNVVFNVTKINDYLQFEKEVKDSNSKSKSIDIYIPKTKVIIEQKSSNIDLEKPQPGHNNLTPFEQALEYQNSLPLSEKAKWIILCNFKEFHIYNMDTKQPIKSRTIIRLDELPQRYHEFGFLIDNTVERIIQEKEVSFKAGKIIGQIYDLLLKEYAKRNLKPTEKDLQDINIACVRLVFCLYAEDAGIFEHGQFGNFMSKYRNDPDVFRLQLLELFKVLNTETDKRDFWNGSGINDFPYVNGGLFSQQASIPSTSRELIDYLIDQGSLETDWSLISPTIFGAIFESTLNQETRRVGGMHYTSIENIHKVIDPLFLDDLKQELNEILEYKQANLRKTKLLEFQDKIAGLKFLDPACGSGNFLTETYLSLRNLEDTVFLKLLGDTDFNQELFSGSKYQTIKVSIDQFYGIEINDFAVDVARTALWIAEFKCLNNTLDKGITVDPKLLPLKTNANIIVANALRTDWNTLIPSTQLNYIMGNPPFSGARLMTDQQKEDVNLVWQGVKGLGNLDYVTCWYKVASDYMLGNKSIQTSFVSSNSICQGEQAGLLWREMFAKNVVINNAYQTFIWNSESLTKAHVYCVIIQFSYTDSPNKKLWLQKSAQKTDVSFINQYLLPFKAPLLENRTKPLSSVPEIGIGNQPIDGGFYLFKEDEKNEFIKKEPKSRKYFRKWYGADEFINGYCRYCLWLGDCSPGELRSMPLCLDRVQKVKQFRLASSRKQTNLAAETPTRFYIENFPRGNYIVLPETSSENREYIPIGFFDDTVLCSNRLKIITNTSIYDFGILESIIHMAWMRVVTGRLELRYSYSIGIVYNNFVWVQPSARQKEKIKITAQNILDARNLYPDSTLADLYDPLTMPPELRKAHKENDRAVLELYGLSENATEGQIVERLFELYDAKVSGTNSTGLELL